MQKPSTLIGQCSRGHDVYVTRDLNGDIDGGAIGAGTIAPLPDGTKRRPIVVACDECVKLINEQISLNS